MRDMRLWTGLSPMRIFGAEGDEPDTNDPQAGADNDDAGEGSPDKFSAEYVETLRAENAKRRVAAKEAKERADALEAQIAEMKKAEMSEIERAKTEAETAEALATENEQRALAAETRLLEVLVENAVTLSAIEQGFEDPSDALSMISQDDLVDDEGNVVQATITKRLKALADKKPYLLKASRPGSADGGRRGNPPEDPKDFDSRKKAHLKNMTETGGRVAIGG